MLHMNYNSVRFGSVRFIAFNRRADCSLMGGRFLPSVYYHLSKPRELGHGCVGVGVGVGVGIGKN